MRICPASFHERHELGALSRKSTPAWRTYLLRSSREVAATEAESRMWQILKTRPQGYTFRRQHPLLWRIADFYCAQLRLVVEVDGGSHQHRKGPDGITNRKYTTHGIHILRFKNGQVLFRPEKVMEILDTFISDISSPICESSGTVGRCLIADFMIDNDGHEFALL
jgi:very-short-patch-repair endonuclease